MSAGTKSLFSPLFSLLSGPEFSLTVSFWFSLDRGLKSRNASVIKTFFISHIKSHKS